jgi:hypothetical protein
MPRCMSFTLTTGAVRNHTKTVTRRLGWDFLKSGDLLWACEKCRGLRRGEKVERLALIRVVNVRHEKLTELDRLCLAGQALEMQREGFPGMTVPEFITKFCNANCLAMPLMMRPCDVLPWWVNRIEFEYVEGGYDGLG